jgi:outer membrane translocation and assembly module TamA
VFTAVVFLDAGNVYSTVGQMSLAELRASAGVGFRYRSPVGPIRLDLGVKLDRRTLPTGEIERPTALHISLGEAF